jgi:GNAT superfamily N-acetyltransferase
MGIRPARPDELDALQALQWQSLRHGAATPPPAALEAALWRLRGLAPHHLAAGACLLAEDDNGLAGFILWQDEPLQRSFLPRDQLPPLPSACGRAAALRTLDVAPDRLGTGIGHALLAAAEQRFAAALVETVEALVPPGAEGFFRRHGYVALSAHASRLAGGAVLELRRMVRALPDGPALLRHSAFGAATAHRAATRR